MFVSEIKSETTVWLEGLCVRCHIPFSGYMSVIPVKEPMIEIMGILNKRFTLRGMPCSCEVDPRTVYFPYGAFLSTGVPHELA